MSSTARTVVLHAISAGTAHKANGQALVLCRDTSERGSGRLWFSFAPESLLNRRQEAAVDSRVRIRDHKCVRTSLIELHRTDTTDDGIDIALLLHGIQTTKKQRLAHTQATAFLRHPRGTEKVGGGGIIAGVAHDLPLLYRYETGDGRMGKAHVAFSRCADTGMPLHPFHDAEFVRGNSSEYPHAVLSFQCFQRMGSRSDFHQIDQHIRHGRFLLPNTGDSPAGQRLPPASLPA